MLYLRINRIYKKKQITKKKKLKFEHGNYIT